MNKKIRDHVAAYLKREYAGYYPGDITDDDVTEAIQDAPAVWSVRKASYRWWDDVFCVVEIDGMFIGYRGARTTGDNSPQDCGWKFNPKTICEVRPKEVTTVVYEAVETEHTQD